MFEKLYFLIRDLLYIVKYSKNYLLNRYYLSDIKYNEFHFNNSFGYKPNLNKPITLNEKILWLKINHKNRNYKKYVDKFLVRKYIEEKIGSKYLIPLLAVYNNSQDLNYNFLKSNFPLVIKTNHGSGDFALIKDEKNIKLMKLKLFFRNAQKRNLDIEKKQYQYSGIEKKILIEKMLLNDDNSIPSDFKVHCFNGEPEFIYVTTGRGTSKIYRGVYDLNWTPLNFCWSKKIKGRFEYKFDNNVKKPKNLKKIIELAKKIATDFRDTYVRVDFYNKNNGKIYFGEITFHHMSGFAPIEPKIYDINFGKKLKIL